MTSNNEQYHQPDYLWTREQLLAPEVGAVLIGQLVPDAYEAVKQTMEQTAQENGVLKPSMIADVIFKEGTQSEFGSNGKPCWIRTGEQWEAFARDVPEYCGENVPSVYMVDGARYTTGV